MEASATLLFRHLPASLDAGEREALLRHVGASRVKVMGTAGPMKNTAFAVFDSKEKAAQVLRQLHQADLLGSRLVVEFARGSGSPSVVDSANEPSKGDVDMRGDAAKMYTSEDKKRDPVSVKFDSAFQSWGIQHPRRPELKYLYPPPTTKILTNIMHALIAVPKLYVQVLHLMNKMDLPAPFGVVTPKPPVYDEAVIHASSSDNMAPTFVQEDDVSQKEMEISSSSESELTSSGGEEAMKKPELAGVKRPSKLSKRSKVKKPKLSDLKDIPDDKLPATLAIPISEVFEKDVDTAPTVKKIELRLTSAKPLKTIKSHQPVAYFQKNTSANTFAFKESIEEDNPLQPKVFPESQWDEDSNDDTLPINSSTKETLVQDSDTPVGSFGLLQPPPPNKLKSEDEEDETEEASWGKAKFISSSYLRKHRLSDSEMKDLSVFRRYTPGEPSCRLYIKNVAKQATEEDLHWIYGKYVNWDNEVESNIFDIRLMKEGRMKGQSFITLPTEEAAKKALRDTNAFVFKDKPLVVQFARSAKAEEDKASKI